MLKIIFDIRLLMLISISGAAFNTFAQPLGQQYRTMFYNSSFAGSLGHGRIQSIVQSNIPNKNAARQNFYYVAVDHYIPQLGGGVGYSLEHINYNRDNKDQLGILGNYYTRLVKTIHKVHYSPKITFNEKITLAPSVNVALESYYSNNFDYPGSFMSKRHDASTNIYIGTGFLMNTKRFFTGLAYNRYGNPDAFYDDYYDEPDKVSNFTVQLGASFPRLLKKLAFKPSYTYNSINWNFGEIYWTDNQVREYRNLHCLNVPFIYDNRFFFGFAFTTAARLNLGYKNDLFSVSFSSKALFPVNNYYLPDYPHELAVEFYFLRKKTEPSENRPLVEKMNIKKEQQYRGNYKTQRVGFKIGPWGGVGILRLTPEQQFGMSDSSIKRLKNFSREYLIIPDIRQAHAAWGMEVQKRVNRLFSWSTGLYYLPLEVRFHLIGVHYNYSNPGSVIKSFYDAYESYRFNYINIPFTFCQHVNFGKGRYSLDLYAGPQVMVMTNGVKKVKIESMVDGGDLDSLIKYNNLYVADQKEKIKGTTLNTGIKFGVGLTTLMGENWAITWKADMNYNFIKQYTLKLSPLSQFNLVNNFWMYSVSVKRSF